MNSRQITSLQHPIIKHLVKLRQNRDYRYEHQRLFVEGIKIINELNGHVPFKTLAVLDETLLPTSVKADEVLIVNESIMKKLSGMQSPEGVVAEIDMPTSANLAGLKYIVAFDGVNDPGNVGTLLRTALALGWEGVFILEESCDPFNEKALRAARGATFHLPIAWGSWDQLKELIAKNQLKPVVAELEGTSLKEVERHSGILLILGNEAHGASSTTKKLCQPVTIPICHSMESLNVSIAGGIMMYGLGPKINPKRPS